MLELITLGAAVARRDGEELGRLTTHRQKYALLTYLGLESPVPRDRLLVVFWGERPEDRARHSLSQALYALKRELGKDCLRITGDQVTLRSGAVGVDADRFRAAVDAREWDRALELYQGPFLDGFYLPETPAFEDWQSRTRARLARMARRAFSRAIEARTDEGDLQGALSAAWRWVGLEPTEDEAQHALITLLASAGNRAAALKQYETYRARLQRELGVEPLETTAALVEQIKSGSVPEFQPLSRTGGDGEAGRVEEPGGTSYGRSEHATEGSDRQELQATWREARPAREAPHPWIAFLDELRARRIFHVAALYIAVGWVAIQVADILIQQNIVPGWLFPALLFFLMAGFPVALLLAWAQEQQRAEVREPGALLGIEVSWPDWARKVRPGHVLVFLGVLILGLLVWRFQLERMFDRSAELQEDRIVVFPLVAGEDATLGENAATYAAYALQDAEPLKTIEGWPWLNERQRADIRRLSADDAAAIARAQRARFYIWGRCVIRGDSVDLFLELWDVAGDTVVSRGVATEARDQAPEAARPAMSQLLPALIPGTQATDFGDYIDRKPAAIANFLMGERSYRRGQFARALERYSAALQADSTFTLAALRGAQAASWRQEYQTATDLVGTARRMETDLPARYARFAEGLAAYLDGQPDTAVRNFRSVLDRNPEWRDAWMALGEVYYHLLPNDSPLDSLSEAAFRRAHQLDREFIPALFHLIEIAARKGELREAERLLRQFRDAEPEVPGLVRQAELMVRCLRESPDMESWRAEARDRPNAVYAAARSLAVAASQPDCAAAAWEAVLATDTTADSPSWYRFGALTGLQSLLVARGRYDRLAELWEREPHFGDYSDDFYILNSAATGDLEAHAGAAVAKLRSDFLADTTQIDDVDLWFLAVGEFQAGNDEVVQRIADSLTAHSRRSSSRGQATDVPDSLLVTSIRARAALTRGDTLLAIRLLNGLTPNKKPGDFWSPWESLAAEKRLLAELRYSRGEYPAALDLARNFDAPRPATDLIYLPAALRLQWLAASRLEDTTLAQRARERLRALGRGDLLSGDPQP